MHVRIRPCGVQAVVPAVQDTLHPGPASNPDDAPEEPPDVDPPDEDAPDEAPELLVELLLPPVG